MRKLTISQWNKLWSMPYSGCVWQGMDETEVSLKLTEYNSRVYEMVRIESNHPDMFGIVARFRVDDITEGKI